MAKIILKVELDSTKAQSGLDNLKKSLNTIADSIGKVKPNKDLTEQIKALADYYKGLTAAAKGAAEADAKAATYAAKVTKAEQDAAKATAQRQKAETDAAAAVARRAAAEARAFDTIEKTKAAMEKRAKAAEEDEKALWNLEKAFASLSKRQEEAASKTNVMDQALRDVAEETEETWKEIRAFNESGEALSSTVDELRERYERLAAQTASYEKELNAQVKAEIEAEKEAQRLAESFQKSEENLDGLTLKLNNMLTAISNVENRYPAGTFDQLKNDIKAQISAIDGLKESVSSSGGNMQEFIDKEQAAGQSAKELSGRFAELKANTDKLDDSADRAAKTALEMKTQLYNMLTTISNIENRYPAGTFDQLKADIQAQIGAISNLSQEDEDYAKKVLEAQQRTGEFKGTLAQLRAETDHAAPAVATLGDKFGNLVERYAKFYASSLLVRKPLQLIQSALEDVGETLVNTENAVIELNRVLEDPQPAMEVANRLYDIAYAYGSTFENASQIAANFARAGRSWNESIQATEAALLAMNVAELNATEASDGLLSVLAQFDMEASDLIDVVDKLNKTADKNPVSTQKLLQAIQRAGSAAKNANVSFDQTLGLITAISEATNRSGQNIGTAINSLIQYSTKNIDVFATLSKESEEMVEKFKLGLVSIVDVWNQVAADIKNDKEARDNIISALGTDGLEELSSTLHDELGDLVSEIDGVYNVANTYRKNYFIALLDNMDRFMDVQEQLTEFQGYSQDENAKYMETYAAKVNQLKTAWQQLANDEQGILGFKKNLVEAGIDLVDIVQKGGGIKTVVAEIVALLGSIATFFNGAKIGKALEGILTSIKETGKYIKETVSLMRDFGGVIDRAREAQEAYNAAKATYNALVEAGAAKTELQAAATALANAEQQKAAASAALWQAALGWISLAVTAITLLATGINAVAAAQEKAREEAISLGKETAETAKQIGELRDKMTKLNPESEEYRKTEEQIVELLGDKQILLDGLIKGTEKYTEKVKELTDAELREAQYNAIIAQEAAEKNVKSSVSEFFGDKEVGTFGTLGFELFSAKTIEKQYQVYKSYTEKLAELKRQYVRAEAEGDEELKKSLSGRISAYERFVEITGDAFEEWKTAVENKSALARLALDQSIEGISASMLTIPATARKSQEELQAIADEAGLTLEEVQAAFEQVGQGTAGALEEIPEKVKDVTAMTADELDAFAEKITGTVGAYSAAADAIELVKKAQEEYAEQGQLSLETVEKLSKLGADWVTVLFDESGAVDVNSEAVGYLVDKYQEWLDASGYLIDTTSEIAENARDLSSEIDDVQSSLSFLNSVQEEYNETGTLSIDTLQQLISLDSEYLDLIIDEEGQIHLNKDAVDELLKSKNELLDELMAEQVQQYAVDRANYYMAKSTEEVAEKTGIAAKGVSVLAATMRMLKGDSIESADALVAAVDEQVEALHRMALSSGFYNEDWEELWVADVQDYTNKLVAARQALSEQLSKSWEPSSKSSSSSSSSKSEKDEVLEGHKDLVSLLESELTLMEHQGKSEEEQIAKIREIQGALSAQADYMRSIGASQEDINKLSSEWWKWEEKINKFAEDRQKAAEKAAEEAEKERKKAEQEAKKAAEEAKKAEEEAKKARIAALNEETNRHKQAVADLKAELNLWEQINDIAELLPNEDSAEAAIKLSEETKEIVRDYKDLLADAERLGVADGTSIFGNIDTNNRQVLEWTAENIERFRSALESWGYTADDIKELAGDISTVMGTSSWFGEDDGVEIAFSPILQTENGPVLLTEDAVGRYIYGLIEKAGDNWHSEDLLRLDAEGLEQDGLRIKNLIASIGDDAVRVGEAMHFAGTDGALTLALSDVEEEAKKYNITAKELIALTENISEETREIVRNYKDLLAEAERLGAADGTSIFGNIDTNNRQVLEWTAENIERFRSALESWGYTAEDIKELAGDISTVMGTSSWFGGDDGVEIAFSPILQTENGPVLLTEDAVGRYIYGLIEKAGDNWHSEDLLRLDAEGLEQDGLRIKNLIASIGDDAVRVGEAMHFAGTDGALALALTDVEKEAKKYNITAKELIALTENINSQFGKTNVQSKGLAERVEEMQKIIAALQKEVDWLRYLKDTQDDIKVTQADIDALLAEQYDWQEKILKLCQETLETMRDTELEAQQKVIDDLLKGFEDIEASRKEELEINEKILAVENARKDVTEAIRNAQLDYIKSTLSGYIKSLSDAKTLEEKQNAVIEARRKLVEAEQDARSKAIIDAFKAEKSVKSDALSIEEKRLAVEKARQALIDAENDRTTRVYNESSGQWEYQANAKNVQTAQDNLKKAIDALHAYAEEQAWKEVSEAVENGSVSEAEVLEILSKWAREAYGEGSPEFVAKIQAAFRKAMGTPASPESLSGQVSAVDKAVESLNEYLKQEAIKELEQYIAAGNTDTAGMRSILNKWLSMGEGGELYAWRDGLLNNLESAISSGWYDETKVTAYIDKVDASIKSLDEYLRSRFIAEIKDIAKNGTAEELRAAIEKWDKRFSDVGAQIGENGFGLSDEDRSWGKSVADAKGQKETTASMWKKAMAGDKSSGTINWVLNRMKQNSAAWWDADRAGNEAEKKRLSDENFALGRAQGWNRRGDGHWYDESGYRIYDKGGILRGKGGIKATNRPEAVLDPDLTAKILTPTSDKQFRAFTDMMHLMFERGGRTRYDTPIIRNPSVTDSHNTSYTVNGIPIPAASAERYTVAELFRMLPMARS